MAKKPKESHRAYKEWAPSINYYNKILLELYIQKINGRATELCPAHTLKFVPQISFYNFCLQDLVETAIVNCKWWLAIQPVCRLICGLV